MNVTAEFTAVFDSLLLQSAPEGSQEDAVEIHLIANPDSEYSQVIPEGYAPGFTPGMAAWLAELIKGSTRDGQIATVFSHPQNPNLAAAILSENHQTWGIVLARTKAGGPLNPGHHDYLVRVQQRLIEWVHYRRAEAKLESSRRMTRWLAHEVRNPLTGLTGFASILSMDLEMNGTLPSSDVSELLTMVSEQSQRLVTKLNLVQTLYLSVEETQSLAIPMSIGQLLQSLCVSIPGGSLLEAPEGLDAESTLLHVNSNALEGSLSHLVQVIPVSKEAKTPAHTNVQVDTQRYDNWPNTNAFTRFSLTVHGWQHSPETDAALSPWSSQPVQPNIHLEIAANRLRAVVESHQGYVRFLGDASVLKIHITLPYAEQN